MRRLILIAALWPLAAAALAPLGEAPWRVVGLPKQDFPLTRFTAETVDGRAAVRIEAERSYGNLVHPVEPPDGGRTLSWTWRLDTPITGADLRRKAGDDAALKVCALFDLPLEALGMIESAKMRMARAVSGEWLPAATLCYVWDPALPVGTLLPNAHSPRLRWIVARGAGTPLGGWQAETRDLHADFLRAFGDEAREVPPLKAIALGADADNTGGRSLGFVAAPALRP
jgi:hypothetical protein